MKLFINQGLLTVFTTSVYVIIGGCHQLLDTTNEFDNFGIVEIGSVSSGNNYNNNRRNLLQTEHGTYDRHYTAYQSTSSSISWSDAQSYCESLSSTSNLASIHDETTNTNVYSLISSVDSTAWAWIGGHSPNSDSIFEWIDNSNWDYTKWSTQQPDNGGINGYDGNEDCLHFWPPGTWNDAPCNYHTINFFICEDEIVKIKTEVSSNLERTYISYHSINIINWNNAKLFCNDKSMTLAIINNNEEQIAAFETVRDIYERVWIGMSDLETEGIWKWINGNIVGNDNSYTNWSPNQPDNSNNNEHCGQMLQNGKWNDAPCTSVTNYFICSNETSFYLNLVRPISAGTDNDRHHLHINEIEIYDTSSNKLTLLIDSFSSEDINNPIINTIDGNYNTFGHTYYPEDITKDHFFKYKILNFNFQNGICLLNNIIIHNRDGVNADRIVGSYLELIKDTHVVERFDITSLNSVYTFSISHNNFGCTTPSPTDSPTSSPVAP